MKKILAVSFWINVGCALIDTIMFASTGEWQFFWLGTFSAVAAYVVSGITVIDPKEEG